MRQWGAAVRGVGRVDVVLGALTVLLAVLLTMRWWDLPRWPIPVLQAGFPVLGLAGVVWFLALVVARRWQCAVLAAVVLVIPAVPAAAALRTSTVPPRSGDEVVLVANLEFGAADARTVLEQVARLDVTTLVLVEITPEAARRLERAGLSRALPHHVGTPRAGSAGTVIRSRHPLSSVSEASVPRRFDQPVARVRRPGAPYLLRAVHTYPPERGLSQAWRRQLGDLESWAAAQRRNEPVVLAGDFNASQAHPGFRRHLTDFTDAHRTAGGRWVRTWPQNRTIPPFIALDHVLVRGGQVVDAGTADVPRTDHAAAWARLRIG